MNKKILYAAVAALSLGMVQQASAADMTITSFTTVNVNGFDAKLNLNAAGSVVSVEGLYVVNDVFLPDVNANYGFFDFHIQGSNPRL